MFETCLGLKADISIFNKASMLKSLTAAESAAQKQDEHFMKPMGFPSWDFIRYMSHICYYSYEGLLLLLPICDLRCCDLH